MRWQRDTEGRRRLQSRASWYNASWRPARALPGVHRLEYRWRHRRRRPDDHRLAAQPQSAEFHDPLYPDQLRSRGIVSAWFRIHPLHPATGDGTGDLGIDARRLGLAGRHHITPTQQRLPGRGLKLRAACDPARLKRSRPALRRPCVCVRPAAQSPDRPASCPPVASA